MAARTYDEANLFQRGARTLGATRGGSWFLKRTQHHLDRWYARLSGRPVMLSEVLAGVPTVMLTTTGARSGQPRTVPLLAFPVDDGWGVIASRYGSATPPAWYHNLRADPQATLEIEGVRHLVRAEQVHGADRDRVLAAAVAYYSGYAQYEQRAGGRDLGFFILHPEHD